MKKYQFVFIGLMIMVFGSCKKDGNNTMHTQSFTPAYITPSAPGYIQVSAQQLSLHIGASVQVKAILYNSDGSLSQSQPVFVWQSNNTSVANVSNGMVQTTGTGYALISVTDGTHGIEYVNVSVLADTTTLATGANITFNPPFLTLATNQSANFTFSVTDFQGNNLSATPQFQLSSTGSGLNINGSTISAGTSSGFYTLTATLNNSQIYGSLYINVGSAPSNSQSSDTAWQGTGFRIVHAPAIFSGFNQVADPVIISVFEMRWLNGLAEGRCIQTSPQEIDIDYPSVITANTSGQLVSVTSGSAKLTLKYNGASGSLNCFVLYDFNSNWSGQYQGKTLNICLSNPSFIKYNDPGVEGYYNYPAWQKGDYLIGSCSSNGTGGWLNLVEPGIAVDAGITSSANGSLGEIAFANCSSVSIPNNGIIFLSYKDNDHISGSDHSNTFTLTRGSGNCSGNPTNNLAQILTNSIGHTWYTDNCTNSTYYNLASVKFNNGGAIAFSDAAGSNTQYWAIIDSAGHHNWLYSYNSSSNDVLVCHVQTFSSTSLVIDSLDYGDFIISSPVSAGWFINQELIVNGIPAVSDLGCGANTVTWNLH